jgi:excisionase family DNA binding protein
MKAWLTVAEVAEYSGVSRDTIYTACERGELRHAAPRWTRAIRETRIDRRVVGAAHARRTPLRAHELAEGEGFEPPVPFRVQWFSRPPPSTTRPSLRVEIRPQSAHPYYMETKRAATCHRSVTITAS